MAACRFLLICLLFAVCNLQSVVMAVVPLNDDVLCSADSLSRRRAFDYFYLQALSLKEKGEYDAAMEMFEHCRAIDPDSPAVLFELSGYYMYLGKKNEALDLMKRAVHIEPDNFWYRQVLATAYENNGQRSEAVSVYESMASDFPSRSEICLVLAGLYSEEAMFEKAVSALDAFERKEGKSEQISMQKYNIYMQMGDEAKAISEINALAAEYPDDLKYRVLSGNVYLQNGKISEAYDIYREVLSLEPDNVQAQLAMANYYKVMGNDSLFKEQVDTLLMNTKLSSTARSELFVKIISEIEKSGGDTLFITNLSERLMTLPGNQLPVLVVYAQYLMMKDAGEQKLSPLLMKILELEPENKMAQLQLLSFAIKRKDYPEIISRSDTAILYNPDILQLYYYRGIACFQLEMPEEAVKTFRKGLCMRAQDTEDALVSELFALVGDAEHELGNRSATLEAYDSALVYNPENIVVLNNYAYYLALDGAELERAEEMSFKTLRQEPDNPIYIDTYMWILFLQGRYEEAKAYAEKLIITNNDMSSVEYSHCGDIFALCGDLDRAVDFWSEAQKMGDVSKVLQRKIKKKKYIPDEKNKREKKQM